MRLLSKEAVPSEKHAQIDFYYFLLEITTLDLHLGQKMPRTNVCLDNSLWYKSLL